jgi:DNA-binding SARP family transcriptional activator/CheY-like chemotaxis protein
MEAPIRIFLLEDDVDLRSALESVLELEGYRVVAAADGAEAVAKAEDYAFDILVFDIKLPGPDGLEVLAQFKKENPEVLSVVMTGYATEKDTLRALRLGVGDYLKKPFKSDVLLDAVRRLEREVHRRRALEEREQSASKMFLWLVEFMVGGLEANHEVKGLTMVESARSGFKFAQALGHSRRTAETLQSAVLISFLREYGEDDERLTELTQMLPAATVRLLSELEELATMEASAPDSLAALAKLCKGLTEQPGRLKELEEMTGVSLQTDQPGRVQRERRQLLSLARTFAASGDPAAARDACVKLTEVPRTAEAGYAYLELARIAWAEGERTEANKNLRSLLGLLSHLGPQTGAELELEAGLSALGMGMKDGQQLLERTLPRLDRMGLAEGHALALLSLRATSEESGPLTEVEREALGQLTHHGLTATLLSHSRWLLRPLLQLQLQVSEEQLQKLLGQIAQDATRSVGQALSADLEEPELELLLGLIEERGGSALLPSLQSLFARTKSGSVRGRLESIISGMTNQDSPTLRLNSLGTFEVWIGDHRLPETAWRTSRSRFLLAQLAARVGRPVLAEVLIEQFWPAAKPESGKKNLSQTVSDLRKVMAEGGFELADELVVRKHELVSLNSELPIWYDLDAFCEALGKGRVALESGGAREAHQQLRRAYALIRGDYLEDCSMEWVLPQRRELERQSLECCELLARSCQKLELYPELLEVANRVLERDPCYQAMHLLIMEAYTASGRPESALRQFERATAALKVELGVEPSTDLLRAQQLAKMAL